MLASQIRRLRPGFVLLQHPDDLIFREPCSLHLSVLQEGRTLNPRGGKSQWQGTAASHSPSALFYWTAAAAFRLMFYHGSPNKKSASSELIGWATSSASQAHRDILPILFA